MKVSYFNQKLLLNIFTFIAIFMGFALILRIIMHVNYIDWKITQENIESIFRLYQYGLAYDLRVVTSALILPFVVGYVCHFFAWGRENFFKFFACYVGVCGFLFALIYLIDFFYFQIYHTQIDIFIFGLIDDNTKAILEIALRDYPLIWGLVFSLGIGYLSYFLARKLIRSSVVESYFVSSPPPYTKLISLIAINFIFLFFFVAGVRGGFFSEPLLRAQSNVSSLKLINHLVPNPIIAFAWAITDYKNDTQFFKVQKDLGEKLAQKACIAEFATTSRNDYLKRNPPHVILNLMESFGNNLLAFDDVENFDLLGALRSHFESDFVFSRFLSYGNGTSSSLAGLFFNSPSAQIGLSKVKKNILEGNPFALYAQNGYEIIFLTAGNASWMGYGDYILAQGAHYIYDANALIDLYPQAKQYRTAYGIPDEYVYNLLEKLLSEAKKPLFVVILTISNHPPEIVPTHYKSYPLQKDISKVLPSEKSTLIAEAYQYANDSFGRFLDFIKSSSLRDKTIIAATGDHRMRSLIPFEPQKEFLNFSVPFYLYIPKPYLENIGFEFDAAKLGSHKDIFPTLFTYSLSNVRYFCNGGENMLSKSGKHTFAYNEVLFANNLGIYVGGEQYFPWKNQTGIEVSEQPKKAPKSLMERVEAYKEFQWWQIRARSVGVQE